MSVPAEQWRVSTVEGIFETDLETLKQWIVEGCVLPTDKVSKGKLGWIDAGKAPMLRAAFNGELGTPPPAPAPVQAAQPTHVPAVSEHTAASQQFEAYTVEEESFGHDEFAPPAHAAALQDNCHNHPEVSAKYVCRVCGAAFCAECPRFVGTTPLCTLCGDMCKPFEEFRSNIQRREFQGSGFGINDFFRALKYPLQHKLALAFGAAIYGFMLLAGFRGQVIAFVIMFGCISHVISQVAWGRLHRSFLPDFSSFSMWDDLAVPLGLGIGIFIVTWGPTSALALALFFGVINGGDLSATGPVAPETPTVTQQDVGTLTDPEADPKKLEEAYAKINSTRPGSVISKEAEKSQKELNDPTADMRRLTKMLSLSIGLGLLLLLSVLWAVFYGPMALCVAGYTEHFGSVINPLVGLDTIRRMGLTYFKAFGMVMVVKIVGFVVSIIVALITAPFSMPFFGNLPANFIDGGVTFYFNLVVACILGLSLHKSADRLGIDLH
jgi:hypothetical protein